MQKTLTALLADTAEDDNSGQVASQGFSYQEWYAVLLITELLEKPDDFALGIELKEDIAILNSASEPTAVEFCQVKSNEQSVAWTLADLHRKGRTLKDGTNPPSILGKLYKRRHELCGHSTKLRFVSNTGFKIKDNDVSLNSHDYFLSNLSNEGKEIVARAIAEQLSLVPDDIELDEVRLHRSDLPLGQQHLFVSGKLSELARKRLLQFRVPEPDIAATMLASEVRKKASNTSYAATFEELKLKRLMSRQDALQTLIYVSDPPKTVSDLFAEAIERLNQEGYDYGMVDDISNERVRLLVATSDRTNVLFKRQVVALARCHQELKDAGIPERKQLGGFMEQVAAKAIADSPEDFQMISKPLLYALTLMVIRNGIDINVFTAPTNSQPEAEE